MEAGNRAARRCLCSLSNAMEKLGCIAQHPPANATGTMGFFVELEIQFTCSSCCMSRASAIRDSGDRCRLSWAAGPMLRW